jgi:ferredoxin-NADP reductase
VGEDASGRVGAWQSATVVDVRRETATAKTFRLDLGRPSLHLAGQHYLVRLTAPDGYQATRSYSVASAPDGGSTIELTVERLPDGEVSAFLHDEVVAGDELEVRGPVGRWFVWRAETPALLVGGGSGVVPLMAMLRLARQRHLQASVQLVVSVRTPGDLYYSAEMVGPETTVVFTRATPPGHLRPPGHLVLGDLPQVLADGTVAYVCGSSAFADHAADLAVQAGVPVSSVRVERFGPTG